jgi:hypothetical protein
MESPKAFSSCLPFKLRMFFAMFRLSYLNGSTRSNAFSVLCFENTAGKERMNDD